MQRRPVAAGQHHEDEGLEDFREHRWRILEVTAGHLAVSEPLIELSASGHAGSTDLQGRAVDINCCPASAGECRRHLDPQVQ
jgi:hypothetical protein